MTPDWRDNGYRHAGSANWRVNPIVSLKTGAKVEDPALDHRAAELAARYGLPGGADSDAHDPDGIGAAYLEMPDFEGPPSSWPSLPLLRSPACTSRTRSAMPVARRRDNLNL